jgi:hypothetical protein
MFPADEQRILSELDKGVTVGGKTFNIGASERAQAENRQNSLLIRSNHTIRLSTRPHK